MLVSQRVMIWLSCSKHSAKLDWRDTGLSDFGSFRDILVTPSHTFENTM